jgi:RNA polymerase sigma-70 factor, ECF subfamily
MKDDRKYQEKILLFKAVNGEPEAFAELFDYYSKKIYRYIFFKVSSQQLAEDLSSQAFLKAWEYLSQNKKIKDFQSFIYQIARNLVIDYYRSREKEELPLIYTDTNEELADENQVDPDREIDRETLKKLLEKLEIEYKEIIVLRYIEDMSIKEISKIVDKSANHIRVIIHRAIKELRRYYLN